MSLNTRSSAMSTLIAAVAHLIVAAGFHMNDFLNLDNGLPKPEDLLKESGRIRGSEGRFIDEDGRERIFHGINIAFKGFPWHPELYGFHHEMSFSDIDIELLANLGMNVVRLGVMWTGVEPVRGALNKTYLKVMTDLVDRLGKYGIYVMIDAHQDLIGRKFCGDGFPDWAVNVTPGVAKFPKTGATDVLTRPYKLESNGVPEPGQCTTHKEGAGWTLYMASAAVKDGYRQLYQRGSPFQDAFVKHWTDLAESFHTSRNLLGYDLINEPQAAHVKSIFNGRRFERRSLQPFYDRLANSIRQVHQDAMIFFENWVPSFGKSGFTHVPGGPKMVNQSVLAYHYYYPLGGFGGIRQVIRDRYHDIRKLGCVGFLGEWGVGIPEGDAALDAADRYVQSWAVFQYKKFFPMTGWGTGFFPNASGILDEKVPRLARTYAPAVAGRIVSTRFDKKTAKFELVFVPRRSCRLPTEIYVNKLIYYPRGYTVEVEPMLAAKVDNIAPNRIHVYNDPMWLYGMAQAGHEARPVKVTIRHNARTGHIVV